MWLVATLLDSVFVEHVLLGTTSALTNWLLQYKHGQPPEPAT